MKRKMFGYKYDNCADVYKTYRSSYTNVEKMVRLSFWLQKRDFLVVFSSS